MEFLDDLKVITLDLDDTLWAIDPVIEAAEQAMYVWLTEHCPEMTARYDIDRLRRERLALAEQRPDLRHDLTATRMLSLTAALSACGYDQTAARMAFDVLMEARNQVECYEDVIPALDHLSEHYVLGAITNGNADLARIGLDHYFEFVICARDVGAAKPDPVPFHRACAAVGCEARQIMHAGDHPEHDIAGAQRVGMRTAWVNRAGIPWHAATTPDIEVTSLLELARHLTPLVVV